MNQKKTLVLPEVYTQVSAGGPFAVVRKMYETDKERNFSYIKIDQKLELWNIPQNSRKKPLVDFAKFFLGKISSFPVFFHICFKLIATHKKISCYHISEYEYIISHNIFYSYIVLRFYKQVRLIDVYHGQGSMYREYCDLGGYKKNFFTQKLLNHIECYVCKHSWKNAFPSYGAYETLISTHSEIETCIKKYNKQIYVLYNAVDISVSPSHNIEIENYIDKDIYNFVSISSVVFAKGVDQIPKFLRKLKEKNIPFRWIIIGRRNSYSYILKENIEKYGIQSETYLHETGIPKSEIYGLLSKTDFYIMFHRYSIFDLATLEAMYLGNIPVLSNVGGNKEVVLDNNGVLFAENEFDNVERFIRFLDKYPKEELREKNKKVVENSFSDSVFIQRYYDLIND